MITCDLYTLLSYQGGSCSGMTPRRKRRSCTTPPPPMGTDKSGPRRVSTGALDVIPPPASRSLPSLSTIRDRRSDRKTFDVLEAGEKPPQRGRRLQRFYNTTQTLASMNDHFNENMTQFCNMAQASRRWNPFWEL